MSPRGAIRRLDALDGIRGVLVVFLLCYHFGFTQITGAWLTLNVFFVLSGFLIVRLLVQERAHTGRIDFLSFYARRARRLFPALTLLLAAIVGYGLGFAPQQQRGQLRWDLLATMGYFMNWRLIAQSNQYFVQFAEPSMLQHTWSLSVEEQFYLVVPALLLLLMAVLRTRWSLITVLTGMALMSAAWMATVGVGSAVARSHLYYGTDTRAQSLLLGAALGVWMARFGAPLRPIPFSVNQVQWIGGLALAITLVGFVVAEPQTTLMADGGMFALSLAAVAWVWAAADERVGPLQRMLSVRPLAALGRVSYGAYLWHWPIGLWIGQAMPGAPVWLRAGLGFILTISVASVSYRFVEKPIHDRGWRAVIGSVPRARTVAASIAVGLVAGAIGIGVGAPAADGVPRTRAPVRVVPLIPGQPAFHRPAKPYTVALYGDSVPYLLVKNFPRHTFPGVTAKAVAAPGCDLLDQPWIDPQNGAEPNIATCRAFKEDIPGHIAAAHADLMIIVPGALLGFRHQFGDRRLWWTSPAYVQHIRIQLDRIASAAAAAGTKLAIVTQTCRSDRSVGLGQLVDDVRHNDPPVLEELETADHVNAFVRTWARQRRVPVADLHHAVCPTGVPRSIPGIPIFGDGIHFSPQFTPSVWAFLLAELGKDR